MSQATSIQQEGSEAQLRAGEDVPVAGPEATTTDQTMISPSAGGSAPSTTNLIDTTVSPFASACGRLRNKETSHSPYNCGGKPALVCTGCNLVAYCTKKCQRKHWHLVHKDQCNDIVAKNDWSPAGGLEPTNQDYDVYAGWEGIWGEIPGQDVFSLERNEGAGWEGDLSVLFLASGDLGSLITTVVGLPESQTRAISGVLNDRRAYVAVRNLFLLLLSVLLVPLDAAPIMLHLWYSGRLSYQMAAVLVYRLQPEILKVVEKSAGRPDWATISETWAAGQYSVTANFSRTTWLLALELFKCRLSDEDAEIKRREVMLDPAYQAARERRMHKYPRHSRLSYRHWTETGILLPFTFNQSEYSLVNPTLYKTKSGTFLPHHSADPMRGYNFEEVLGTGQYYGVPKNDIYGSLYFHVLEKLTAFCFKVKTAKLHLHLCQEYTMELPNILHNTLPSLSKAAFDRIDAGNDVYYNGLEETLTLYTPLLKTKERNPHATLITLFLDAIEDSLEDLGDTPLIPPPADPYDKWALMILRDYDQIFGHYMDMHRDIFENAPAMYGVAMRGENTIVLPWPLRCKQEDAAEASTEAFQYAMMGVSAGSETLLEWGWVSDQAEVSEEDDTGGAEVEAMAGEEGEGSGKGIIGGEKGKGKGEWVSKAPGDWW